MLPKQNQTEGKAARGAGWIRTRSAAHVERLYRAAYGLCGSRQDAEDLVQDTYERVLRRPRFVRRDDDLAYLLRVLAQHVGELAPGRARGDDRPRRR